MLDGYIYNALRTPFGRHAGALAKMRAASFGGSRAGGLLFRQCGAMVVAALAAEEVIPGGGGHVLAAVDGL